MKHYKDPATNQVFAFAADGTQDEWIPSQLVSITDSEADAIRNPPPTLSQSIASALTDIDADAGKARARYITIAPGQEATYLLKAQQAVAFKAAGYTGPVPGLVQAEIDATGATATVATDAILTQQAAWEAKAAQIESARRTGKVHVASATNVAAVKAALDIALAALAAA